MSLDEGQFKNRIRKESKKGNKNITCIYRAAAFPSKMSHERGSSKVSLSDRLGNAKYFLSISWRVMRLRTEVLQGMNLLNFV